MLKLYSRTSMARTLMAHLPVVSNSFLIPLEKNPNSCRFRMNYDDFLFYGENEVILMRTHNIPSC